MKKGFLMLIIPLLFLSGRNAVRSKDAAMLEKYRFAFEDDSDFEKPRALENREPPQSFEDYVRSKPVRVTAKRTAIVIQPLGKFTADKKELIKKLGEFISLYFCCEVRIAQEKDLPENGFRMRVTPDGKKSWRQYKTGPILFGILKPNLSRDAVCYFGITMEDLYHKEDWNYLFGQASLQDRVALFSLCRYFSHFWRGWGITRKSYVAAGEKLSTYRSMGVISHEIGHVFGLGHCQYYLCNMCYANSLDELDRYPVHLCPICLKKLCWNRGFDVLERYEKLREFYEKNGFGEEARWTKNRIEKIRKNLKGQ